MNCVPVIPENAPFTAEQRAYLNGFLAGLFSRSPAGGPAPGVAPPAARPLEPLAILFGSQTGTCEKLAKRLAKEAGQHGFAPTIHDLARYSAVHLANERSVLIITSTYGDGDPPDNANAFWNSLTADTAPKLARLHFSLCALGDSNYPKFCGFGRQLDARLEALGATRAFARMDCDVEYEEPFVRWMAGAVAALTHASRPHEAGPAVAQPAGNIVLPPSGSPDQPSTPPALAAGTTPTTTKTDGVYSRKNPFLARLKTNRLLNAPGSGKEVRHYEIDLSGSSLGYEAGDALAVLPRNDPALVDELLAALSLDRDEAVPGPDGQSVALHEALAAHYEITRIPKPLLQTFAERSGEEVLRQAAAPDANGHMTEFLRGREIIDLLLAHPQVRFGPAEFTALLRRLQPRLYSIASSLKAHPAEVHLTVGTVRYVSLGRARTGVCSVFLADRVRADTPLPVFVHANNAFRPPAPATPLIMVGPGTGIAPFRAFLQERRLTGATGRNWLFFGDQKSSTDFLYREELESFHREGLLSRLDLAWSREGAQKVYVQHRMLEHAGALFAWLEEGAAFCVCGDAARMAKDVDAALHEVIQRGGGKTSAQAAEYVRELKAQKRYLRDVY